VRIDYEEGKGQNANDEIGPERIVRRGKGV
jgi:hypothetical protein